MTAQILFTVVGNEAEIKRALVELHTPQGETAPVLGPLDRLTLDMTGNGEPVLLNMQVHSKKRPIVLRVLTASII